MDDCVVCGGRAPFSRRGVKLETFELCRCRACQSWIAFPRPTERALSDYHDTSEYFAHPYLDLRRSASAATRRRCRLVFDRLRTAVPGLKTEGARMIDVGCDTGGLLSTAQQEYGIVPFGVDVARRAVAEASGRGLTVHHGTLGTAPKAFDNADIITAIDLVEHVAAPVTLFSEFSRRLRPGGHLYIETPNIQSTIYLAGRALYRVTRGVPRALFARLFPPEHVEYYSRRGLEALASRCHLILVSAGTRPLPMSEIAVSPSLRAALGALQLADWVGHRHALRWAVFRSLL